MIASPVPSDSSSSCAGSRVSRSPGCKMIDPPGILPVRIFGPWRSCKIEMARPRSFESRRKVSITRWCTSWVPWEKLRRAQSIPTSSSSFSRSGESQEGPMVQIIRAKRVMGLLVGGLCVAGG